MVKEVAVTPSTSAHDTIRESVDDEANAANPSGYTRKKCSYNSLVETCLFLR